MAATIIVAGGGPAGLMAAGQAATTGAEVLLLEKMKQPGRKLKITGKGRCNITNTAEITNFIEHFGRNGKFLRQAFQRFFNKDLTAFFSQIGLKVTTERGGRIFPASGRATDVSNALVKWNNDCGVKILPCQGIDKLLIRSNRISGVVSQGKKFPCDCLILATGGASYPATGSTGDGYRLAESAGHSLIPVRPALVPLKTSENWSRAVAGLELRNINASLYVDGKKRREEFGELFFEKYGLTGPVILTLSGTAVDCMHAGQKVLLSLDLKAALDEKKLEARLLRDIAARGKEHFSVFLRGLLPQELVPVCSLFTGIEEDRMVCTISAKDRRRLRHWLKNFQIEITGSRPMAEAIVTAGGINIREINPRTMESNITKGLYLAGELLDVHADTGGYNLQAAFSTGWLAGISAALSVEDYAP